MSVRRCSLSVVAVSCLVALVAEPAYAQTDAPASAPAVLPSAAPQVFVSGGFPGVETSLTWAVLKDFTLSSRRDFDSPLLAATSKMGFNIGVTANRNAWLGATLEGGASFLQQDVPGFEGVAVAYELQEWTVLAGPKFTVRSAGFVEPFFQFLAGAAYMSLEAPLISLSLDEWEFVLQPGVGLDIVVSEIAAVRLGFDGRLLSDRAFAGPTYNQFRFTLGVTFRSAHR